MQSVPMDILRKYLWLWVILGMIFVSVVICVIFLLINKCISRKGKHRISQLEKRSVFPTESNKYQETNLVNHQPLSTPPLPPRTQFLTAEAQSYENLAEAPEYEQDLPDNEQDSHDYEEAVPSDEQNTNDYEQALPEHEQNTNDYEQAMPEYEQDSHDYEEEIPEYEEAIDEPPDYVKVEAEEESFPPPPLFAVPDLAEDNDSTEDYDDIGEEAEEEDYDDVA
ncbi:uncharacterized protein LOC113168848 isoform X2 [Anabas testudineus]|uniref:uncharacterized protein LOC113168848 isoform X2 n=1 Tax=Anabas testudineus TaxID=64144 RepID=UPI000E46462A|nr:uncharacterized protein LOC113168848 isoform X2 [Anabas testudineus]